MSLCSDGIREISSVEPIGNVVETFDWFTKISDALTSLLAASPMDDFSEAGQSDQRVSDQPMATIEGVAFRLLDRGAIAVRFVPALGGQVRLRMVIVRMGALRRVRSLESSAFFCSSLPSIVIPANVETLGSS
jgi:hypothetical protein